MNRVEVNSLDTSEDDEEEIQLTSPRPKRSRIMMDEDDAIQLNSINSTPSLISNPISSSQVTAFSSSPSVYARMKEIHPSRPEIHQSEGDSDQEVEIVEAPSDDIRSTFSFNRSMKTPKRRTPSPISSSSSTSRRSVRLAQQEEKRRENHQTKRLNFSSIHSGSEDESNGDCSPPPSPCTRGNEREIEMDDFLVPDDFVEYYEDKDNSSKKTIIDVRSSDEEEEEKSNEEENEDLTQVYLIAQRSRDPRDWFAIYLEYLAACLMEKGIEKKVNEMDPKTIRAALFKKSLDHTERLLCSRRDDIQSGTPWDEFFYEDITSFPYYLSFDYAGSDNCGVCCRQNHPASVTVLLCGLPYNAKKLYSNYWIHTYWKGLYASREWKEVGYALGSVCHTRTMLYADLLHAKRHWVDMLRMRHEKLPNLNAHDLISDKELLKREYNRFNRLLRNADHFLTSEKSKNTRRFRLESCWKYAYQNGKKEFNKFEQGSSQRRGTLESILGSRSGNSNNRMEEGNEEEKEEDQVLDLTRNEPDEPDEPDEADDDDDDDELMTRVLPSPKSIRRHVYESDSENISSSLHKSNVKKTPCKDFEKQEIVQPPATVSVGTCTESSFSSSDCIQEDRKEKEKKTKSPRCIICHQNPRDACIVHGKYAHWYGCYTCCYRIHLDTSEIDKENHPKSADSTFSKKNCLICQRPITQILHLLPTTTQAEDFVERTCQIHQLTP